MQNLKEMTNLSLLGRILIGKVVINIDPMNAERVKVRIPELYNGVADNDLPWAIPIRHRVQGTSNSSNDTDIPAIGTDVFIQFDGGNKYSPFYLGSARPPKLAALNPNQYGFTDLAGNNFVIDTNAKTTTFTDVSGSVIKIAPSGITVTTTNATVTTTNSIINSTNTTLNSTGAVDVTAATITLNGTGAVTVTGSPVIIM